MTRFSQALLYIFLSSNTLFSKACVVPTGIEQNCPIGSSDCLTVSAYDGIPTDPTFSVFGTAVGTILQIQPGLYGYETPIQNHLTSSAMVPIYGAAAAFHDTALELFGKFFATFDKK